LAESEAKEDNKSKNFPQNKLQFIVIERIELRLLLPFLFTPTLSASESGKTENFMEAPFYPLFCARCSVAVL
jgi:hypothetical protein